MMLPNHQLKLMQLRAALSTADANHDGKIDQNDQEFLAIRIQNSTYGINLSVTYKCSISQQRSMVPAETRS